MIDAVLPRRTKYVPMTEVMMHTPPASSGSVISRAASACATSRATRTIVAPSVTT